jgi:hypothetical protein
MVLALPGGFLSGDGVEDRQELSTDGDEGELGRLAGLAETLAAVMAAVDARERPWHWECEQGTLGVMPGASAGSHDERS